MYPQVVISNLVKTAIQQLYGYDWKPRVVKFRQQRPPTSLRFIDYAFPCFELANELNTTPEKTAIKINTYLKQKSSDKLDDFRTESLNGYVNFELLDGYLEKLAQKSAYWFNEPHLLHKQNHTEFLIMWPIHLHQSSFNTVKVATSHIHSIYQLLGHDISTTLFVDDASKQAVDFIIGCLNTSSLAVNKSDPFKQRKLRQALIAQKSINKDNDKLVNDIRKKWLELAQSESTNQKTIHNSIITGSSITSKVNDFLDELNEDFADTNFVIDNQTGVMFHADPMFPSPLRSVERLLYESAYVLFLVNEVLLKKHDKYSNSRLVLLIPQKIHALVYEYVDILKKNKSISQSTDILCYDPLVSNADIIAIHNLTYSYEDKFQTLAKTLEKKNVKKLCNDTKNRKELLTLIDMPFELSDFVSSCQLPAVFDLLDQTMIILEKIEHQALNEYHDLSKSV